MVYMTLRNLKGLIDWWILTALFVMSKNVREQSEECSRTIRKMFANNLEKVREQFSAFLWPLRSNALDFNLNSSYTLT